ncbi:MAG: cation-translocating P-type ATPase [Planctomycetaceae bacterium]|nr:cation-translocating P-type ATPase [Planctomycetaceae bacterium]
MDCSEELALIERGLQNSPGLLSLQADFIGRRLHIEFDSQLTSPVQIAGQITALGFPAEVPLAVVRRPLAALPMIQPATIVAGALLVAVASVAWFMGTDSPVAWWLAVLSAGVSAISVGRAALRAVRLGSIDMNGLMVLAGTGAIITGDSYEAATALFLFNISLWLEQLSLGRARRAIETLVQIQPSVAHRVTNDGSVDVDVAQVTIGERLLVKPGERFPVDGVVREGMSSVNQAPLTGESLPVDKQPGDAVFSGTLNGSGALIVEATHTAEASTLAHIARLVEQAQATRSPTQRFVDRFARQYTPAVVLLAVIVAVTVPWWFNVPWSEGLHRGLVLLVIACPCALVISTPITIVCGLHRAATRGVLIKGGEFLEAAGRLTTIAFDKTGTLTTGQPELREIIAQPETHADDVLRYAAAVEAHSQHPLAATIVAAAQRRGLNHSVVSAMSVETGRGASGQVDNHTVLVGNARLFQERNIERPADLQARVGEHVGTVVWVALDGRTIGALVLADEVRSDAARTLAELAAVGVQSVVMLTGDHRSTAEQVAWLLNISDVRSELLPADKLVTIEELARTHHELAMVGDGINDAPALAAAPLGIAFGAGASDTALEAADVVIVAPHLSRVAELVRLGRRCRQLLSQNITLAIAIKLITLLAAAGGWASMWMAVAADVGASLVVIFNGMRLLHSDLSPDREGPPDACGCPQDKKL